MIFFELTGIEIVNGMVDLLIEDIASVGNLEIWLGYWWSFEGI